MAITYGTPLAGPARAAVRLLGRDTEQAVLSQFMFDVRSGQSRALVLRGEPGIGKTALLEDAIARAAGLSVIRITGVQSEGEIAYGALHAVWVALAAGVVDQLPEPQRVALRVVFGVEPGAVPDPLLVGLATLNGLAEVARARPLLVVIDDAQWLDDASARTLGFVARRLEVDGVGLLFALREVSGHLAGVPELAVAGLDPQDARALLTSILATPVDEKVLQRFIGETGGNPLALLELPRGLTASEFTAMLDRHDTRGLWVRLEEGFQRQIRELGPDSQTLLLIAAAEPLGDPVLLRRAAGVLGVPWIAVEELELAGLLHVDVQVTLRHPLVRSAVYRFAPVAIRRRVHGALAEVTDARSDPDRRAWHRALASPGPDERIALELEQCSERAKARGGFVAAAAFRERALTMTAVPERRGARALAAAEARLAAGDANAARELLDAADVAALSELDRARLAVARARVAFVVNRAGDASALLLDGARRLTALGSSQTADIELEAIRAAHFAGRLAPDGGVRMVAKAIRATLPPGGDVDEVLAGFVAFFLDDYAVAAPVIQHAVKRLRARTLSREGYLRWLSPLAVVVWDDEAFGEITELQVKAVRELGAVRWMPLAFGERMLSYIFEGEYGEAAQLVENLPAISQAVGTSVTPSDQIALAAQRGAVDDALALMEASVRPAIARGEGALVTFIHLQKAVLHNALGQYEDAWLAASTADQDPLMYFVWILPELIEAAARSGHSEEVAGAMDRLSGMASIVKTNWALGIEAQSRALLSDDADAEQLYRSAIDHLRRTTSRSMPARAHLLFGEWLRRQGRRVDAREHLRMARESFETSGAAAFAARTSRELAATGERVRKRNTPGTAELTPQELRIARLAANGLSNREIGEQLFISHRTVGYHLQKVFTKLGVSNRTQLHQVIAVDTT